MQQVKFFKGVETDLPRLEIQINQWLAESGVRVIQIVGNMAPQTMLNDPKSLGGPTLSPHLPSDVLVAVLYEKN